MSGEVSIDRRLSPTGRFIKNVLDGSLNATDGKLLPIGSGTTGLVWRGVLTTSPTNVGGTAGDPPINLPGQGGAWDLPPGYRYDVETFVTIQEGTGAPTNGDLILLVEGSTDGGGTWTKNLLTVNLPVIGLVADEGACIAVARLVNGPTTTAITHIRTRALRVGAAAADTTVIQDSWTKIIQHVA